MKAAIFNPYLDSLGGGERYTMSFAQVLLSMGYSVDVEWKDAFIKKSIEKRFGMTLSGINFMKNVKRGDGYDVCFWLSDGSIPLLRARKNFLHFQFPFKDVNGRSLLTKMKLFRITKCICNSYFTKRFIDKEFGIESIVIYPPVDTKNIHPKIKENIILSVGRFSQLAQEKNQHILVEVFKTISKDIPSWKLILAGGTDVGVTDYVSKLKKLVREYPIEILENPPFEKIKELFGKARVYWTATGFSINEKKEPSKVEHFGIAVVEAMSGGSVPLVYSAGGHKEIIIDGENGFLWKKKRELIGKTKKLIKDPRLLREIAQTAKKDSQVYEYDRFEAEVQELLS